MEITAKEVLLLVFGALFGFGLTAISQFIGDVGRFSGFGGLGRTDDEAKDYLLAKTSTKSLIMQEYYFASFRYLIIANLIWVIGGMLATFVWFFFVSSALSSVCFLLALGRILRFQRVRRKAHKLATKL